MRAFGRPGPWFAALAVPLLAGSACAGRGHPSPPPGAPTTTPAPGTTIAPAGRPVAVPAPAPSTPRFEPEGTLGGDGPVTLAAVSRAGLFGVLCQARSDTDASGSIEVELGPRGEPRGDALGLSLVLGSGPGEPIDELMAVDPAGRFLVARRGNDTTLMDALEGTRFDLGAAGADLSDDALPHPEHRALAFDATGRYLAYLQRSGDRTAAILRELVTGGETRFELGAGNPWRIQLAPDARWLVVSMVVEDRDGNGELEWPAPRARTPRFACRSPMQRRAAYEPRQDGVSFSVFAVSSGRARQLPGLVTPLGERLMVREPGGRLVLEDARGQRMELLPARCEGRVQHADGHRGLALVSCKRKKGRPILHLVGAGIDVDLGLEGQPRTDAWVTATPSRLIAVYPGQEAALVDLDRRRASALATRDVVLGTHDSRALVLRSGKLLVEDVEGGSVELGVADVQMPETMQQGALVLATPYLVDLSAARVRGRLDRRPLALVPSGRVLVALGGDADALELARGPLGWVEPQPLDAPISAERP